jgi:competence protein ComEC
VPALRGQGVTRLDLVVLSHEDGDHIGGATTVLETFEVDALATSLPSAHALNALAPKARRCLAGDGWSWDGVRFDFLHPASAAVTKRNDQSCVLRIAAGEHAMLLTGDIERGAEAAILAGARALPSDVLLVPHHGSRTSSTPEFVAAVAPRWAVVPVGYRSRFGHPNPEVLARYRAADVQVLRTDLQGAITVRMGERLEMQAERQLRARYWLQ